MQNHPDLLFYWFRSILKTPQWYLTLKGKLEGDIDNIVWMGAPEYFELLRCYLEERR